MTVGAASPVEGQQVLAWGGVQDVTSAPAIGISPCWVRAGKGKAVANGSF